jgi:hypothetical protein
MDYPRAFDSSKTKIAGSGYEIGVFNTQRPIMSDQNLGWSYVTSTQVFEQILTVCTLKYSTY